jgi:glycosyltransferase involved in cell wall biosynthesis
MRVALLAASAPAGNALGHYLADKLAFFLDRQADVRVFLSSDTHLHPAVRPHCHELTRAEAGDAGWSYLRDCDLVVVDFSQHYPLLDYLPLLAGGKPRILFDYHGVTPPQLWPEHGETLERAQRLRGLVWCADATLVHARFTRAELTEATRFPDEFLHQIGYPIDCHGHASGPAGLLRQRLGLASERILLFVGRAAPNKRLGVLVEALVHLADLRPAVHAVLIGEISDLHQPEIERCRQLARDLGVADRLHVLGPVEEEALRDAYRSADLLVTPSRHEGFCLPVLEAMASGLPVLAARAAALPETVGSAGLTFRPDDAADLARQVRRVLAPQPWEGPDVSPAITDRALRVAIVSARYGDGFAGGAEASLRTIAESLHQAGQQVEIFTLAEAQGASPGSTAMAGIAVHRYPADCRDQEAWQRSAEAIRQAAGQVGRQVGQVFLSQSLQSSALLAELHRRRAHFDAVIVGPYLSGLTHAVVHALGPQVLLLPCLHDEPFARLEAVAELFERAGGILYHSAAEQELAQAGLGLNCPGSICIGTWIDTEALGEVEAGRQTAGGEGRYLVYCGRFCPDKGLPRLLDYARRYHNRRPGRFRLVFLGEGSVPIPDEPWALNLGFVPEAIRRNVLAGASALVQLSRNESLSLAALQAWAQAVPVIADAGCAVLADHLRQSAAGRAVDSFQSFAAALDDLYEHPQRWHELGEKGRRYVQEVFGSRPRFVERVLEAIRGLSLPLAERMRLAGGKRAADFDRANWREQFGQVVAAVLDAPPRPIEPLVEIQPRCPQRRAAPAARTTLVPAQVCNRGSHAILAEGPAKGLIRCRVRPEWASAGDTLECDTLEWDTPLPGLLLPGQALAAAVTVPVPPEPGAYRVSFEVLHPLADGARHPASGSPQPPVPTMTQPPSSDAPERTPESMGMSLLVQEEKLETGSCAALLSSVQTLLAAAKRLEQLPDDYVDVTEGWFAPLKRWLKRKLLNNFRRAYVDVLARRQSAFNRQLLTALNELAECCATLDHAGRTRRVEGAEYTAESAAAASVADLRFALSALRSSLDQLEARIQDEASRQRQPPQPETDAERRPPATAVP